MSLRAVRKTTGHTTEDDLAQVLEKVGINMNDKENELMTSVTDQRQNIFEMLADEDGDDDKPTVDNDVEIQQRLTVSKVKRKRKVKKKNNQFQNNDDVVIKDEMIRYLNCEVCFQRNDEFLIETNESRIETSAISKAPSSNLLSVDNRLLNPLNEMKKKFGSSIVEQIERESNPINQLPGRRTNLMFQQRPSTRLGKQNALITPKSQWPFYFKFGLSMKPSSETTVTTGNYFQFEFDKDYQQLQIQFFDSVDRHDIQGIMDILRRYPYHIDALIHLSDVSRMQDDTPTAVDIIERALYSFQQSFHPLFSIARGECKLEYRIQANRSFFICLFKHIMYVGERGCTRTALEFCKVLLSLDSVNDPLAILLLIDYYAIRSEEYNYLIRFYTEENQRLNLNGLPNFAFSIALAYFRLLSYDEADDILQDALIRFPSVLKYLLDKLSIRPDKTVEQCRYFFDSEKSETDALKCVQQLYPIRMSNEWKEKSELEFLRNNVIQVTEIIKLNQDCRIKDYTKLRETCYRRTPVNICRHITLSELNQLHEFLPTDMINGGSFYTIDPFPPSDSIASFQRPDRSRMQINGSYNRIGMLLRSLAPNFNLENFLVAADGDQNENDAGMLQALQESIRDFIRNIGINDFGGDQLQQPPADGTDENDNEFD